jgi:hypothetical protein
MVLDQPDVVDPDALREFDLLDDARRGSRADRSAGRTIRTSSLRSPHRPRFMVRGAGVSFVRVVARTATAYDTGKIARGDEFS